MKHNKKTIKNTDNTSLCSQIVTYLLLTLLPLVVYAVPHHTPLVSYSWYGGEEYSLDLFLRAKGILFPVFAVLALVLVIIIQLREKQQFQELKTMQNQTPQSQGLPFKTGIRNFWPEQLLLGAYVLLCLLSYLCSDYKQIGLEGAVEQNETILILLGYGIVGYSFSILIQKQNLFPTICRAFGIGCLLLLVVSLFQFFSHDLLQYSWVQALVLPPSLRETGELLTLQSDVDASHRVYATLYNPNYLGVYGSLVLPILLFFAAKIKRNWQKAAVLVGILLFFGVLLASGSKTFLMVLLLQIFLFGIILFFRARRYLLVAAVLAGGMLVLFLGYVGFSGSQLLSQLKTAASPAQTEGFLKDIQVQEEGVLLEYGAYELYLTFSIKETGSWIQVSDLKGEEVNYQVSPEGKFCSDIPELSEVYFYAGRMEERFVCVAMIEGIPWYFSNQEEGMGYVFLTPSGKEDVMQQAPTAGQGYERLASGRGYIWSRSIPLLKDNLLLGKGPETFLIQFPQNDYVAAAKVGYYNTIISRPHNAYLQIGIQTGVLSLLAYGLSFLIYVLRTGCSLWKKKVFEETEWIRVSVLISLIGYMVCMLANDSLVVTAPLYWVLFGCGIGLNQREWKEAFLKNNLE